ncbi:hypothetical protein M0805_006509 [Coniferiporia weirii]|nr:hypothetical protein M0805_006509 [Coniferiporia weirii]
MDSSEQPVSASTTSPSDWRYVSEGGATIVFSYCGPSNPLFSGTVLRLRKATIQHSAPKDGNRYGENGEPDDPSIAFQHKVTSQLISPAYLPRLETVGVNRSWLEILRRSSEDARPSERRRKDDIDVRRRKAVLATDLVGGEGWAVEIKPKWGFLPNLTHLSMETCDVKSRQCRFCMHSHYRALKGEDASHEYCPLDLFSGNDERVAHALRCLWKAWVRSEGTINNLKLFVRGRLVDPKDCYEGLRFLLDDNEETYGDVRENEALESFVAKLLPLLTTNPVLRDIAHLQRTLDPLDIEGLFALYEAYRALSTDVPSFEMLFPDPKLEDWALFVKSYLSPNLQAELNHSVPDPAHLRYYVMAYLLSATFKDCSVMLRLGRGESVPDTITVIDLDPKSMTRLKRWAELDRAIAMSAAGSDTKRCHDALHQ